MANRSQSLKVLCLNNSQSGHDTKTPITLSSQTRSLPSHDSAEFKDVDEGIIKLVNNEGIAASATLCKRADVDGRAYTAKETDVDEETAVVDISTAVYLPS